MAEVPGSGLYIFPHLDVKEKADLKRKRGQMSCAECRRLKLKCDKKIPCALARRATPSDVKELYKRIESLNHRVRQLEDALSTLQSTVSSEIHPLLREDQNHQHAQPSVVLSDQHPDQNLPEPNVNVIAGAFGTLSLGESGDSRYFGRSGGSESLMAQSSTSNVSSPSSSDDAQLSATSEVSQLVNSFPFASDGGWDVHSAMNILLSYLPEKQRAQNLAEIYLNYDPWSAAFVSREELLEEILDPVYEYLSSAADAEDITADIPISPQRLALLFFCFAHASLGDYSLPRYHIDSEYYFDLGRASLCLHPIMTSADLSSVQAVGMASLFVYYGGPRYNIEGAWSYITMAVKSGHAIGLHHESPAWGLDEKTLQKRRLIFWELFINDSLMSLTLGRPPSIHLSHGQPLIPDDEDDSVDEAGNREPGYVRWRMEFCRDVLSRVVDLALSPNVPDYETILEIDNRLRQHPVPKKYLNSLRNLFINIHVHRVFFARALQQSPSDPASSTYATSYLAAYRSASAAISLTANYLQKDIEQIIRCWAILNGVFSAGVIVGLIVTHCPKCSEAENSLGELTVVMNVLRICADYSPRAKSGLVKFHRDLPESFQSPSQEAFGPPESNDSSQTDGSDALHELETFMGQTKLVTKKAVSTPTTKSTINTQEREAETTVTADHAIVETSTLHSSQSGVPVAPQQPSVDMGYEYEEFFSHRSDFEIQMSSYPMDSNEVWAQQEKPLPSDYGLSAASQYYQQQQTSQNNSSTPALSPHQQSQPHPHLHSNYSQPQYHTSQPQGIQPLPPVTMGYAPSSSSSSSSYHPAWPPPEDGYHY
ncbi:hypothetical protein D9757_005852 [Collybiopsis confluens]|uniref:Xylanolytic transcriptional activator regulatory domain-containing protein n=1 Tax=Collybiopsis confluens TaxID=2823264 RepID=A0A8H5HN85_9AGAR|nr:hypothetical protein D9757_005852 [Collybiopsis confluens]